MHLCSFCRYDGNSLLSSIECYDPVIDSWEVVTSMATQRCDAGVCVLREKWEEIWFWHRGAFYIWTLESALTAQWSIRSHYQPFNDSFLYLDLSFAAIWDLSPCFPLMRDKTLTLWYSQHVCFATMFLSSLYRLCDLWFPVRFTQLCPLKCNIIIYWCQNVSEKRQVCVCLTAQVTESFLKKWTLAGLSGCDDRGALCNLCQSCFDICFDIVIVISGCWDSSHWLDPLYTCLKHQGFFHYHVQNHQREIMKPVCWCFKCLIWMHGWI